jgi:hypothetical protein
MTLPIGEIPLLPDLADRTSSVHFPQDLDHSLRCVSHSTVVCALPRLKLSPFFAQICEGTSEAQTRLIPE